MSEYNESEMGVSDVDMTIDVGEGDKPVKDGEYELEVTGWQVVVKEGRPFRVTADFKIVDEGEFNGYEARDMINLGNAIGIKQIRAYGSASGVRKGGKISLKEEDNIGRRVKAFVSFDPKFMEANRPKRYLRPKEESGDEFGLG